MNDKIFELQQELIKTSDSLKDAIMNEPDVEKHDGIIKDFSKKESDLATEIEKETEKSKGKLGAIDAMNRRYGKHTVFLASSLSALNVPSHAGTQRKIRMGIEERKKTLNIPYLGKVR